MLFAARLQAAANMRSLRCRNQNEFPGFEIAMTVSVVAVEAPTLVALESTVRCVEGARSPANMTLIPNSLSVPLLSFGTSLMFLARGR